MPNATRLEWIGKYAAILSALVAMARFITDRYDRFLFHVSQLQGAVRSGLVRRDDVQFPLNWYVEKRLCPHKKLLLTYIAENSADEARQFFESLDAWPRCPVN
jgi:hypothetical protein